MFLSEDDERRTRRTLEAIRENLSLRVYSDLPQGSLTQATLDLVDYTVSLSPENLNRDLLPLASGMLDPTTTIVSESHGVFGVRFSGTPSGMEYTALIEALLTFGQSPTATVPPISSWLAQIQHPVQAQIFVSPTCMRCPHVVAMAIQFARLQPLISANIIQVDQFPATGQQHQVLGVPTTWCEPGPYVFTGMPAPEYFAAYLIQASTSAAP